MGEHESDWARERAAMVALIRERGIKDERVLEAMARVPRHLFVPEPQRPYAYDDYPLLIGNQQTISQPYIVALMTEEVVSGLEPGDKVLEIGTGSGYQAAVLAEIGMDVYTVERIPELHRRAKETLAALGYTVHCKLGDGYYGWPEFAPYRGIIVTAAPEEVPPPLLEQLAILGRLVIPLGPRRGFQSLWIYTRYSDRITKFRLTGVAFVPFIHDEQT